MSFPFSLSRAFDWKLAHKKSKKGKNKDIEQEQRVVSSTISSSSSPSNSSSASVSSSLLETIGSLKSTCISNTHENNKIYDDNKVEEIKKEEELKESRNIFPVLPFNRNNFVDECNDKQLMETLVGIEDIAYQNQNSQKKGNDNIIQKRGGNIMNLHKEKYQRRIQIPEISNDRKEIQKDLEKHIYLFGQETHFLDRNMDMDMDNIDMEDQAHLGTDRNHVSEMIEGLDNSVDNGYLKEEVQVQIELTQRDMQNQMKITMNEGYSNFSKQKVDGNWTKRHQMGLISTKSLNDLYTVGQFLTNQPIRALNRSSTHEEAKEKYILNNACIPSSLKSKGSLYQQQQQRYNPLFFNAKHYKTPSSFTSTFSNTHPLPFNYLMSFPKGGKGGRGTTAATTTKGGGVIDNGEERHRVTNQQYDPNLYYTFSGSSGFGRYESSNSLYSGQYSNQYSLSTHSRMYDSFYPYYTQRTGTNSSSVEGGIQQKRSGKICDRDQIYTINTEEIVTNLQTMSAPARTTRDTGGEEKNLKNHFNTLKVSMRVI